MPPASVPGGDLGPEEQKFDEAAAQVGAVLVDARSTAQSIIAEAKPKRMPTGRNRQIRQGDGRGDPSVPKELGGLHCLGGVDPAGGIPLEWCGFPGGYSAFPLRPANRGRGGGALSPRRSASGYKRKVKYTGRPQKLGASLFLRKDAAVDFNNPTGGSPWQ